MPCSASLSHPAFYLHPILRLKSDSTLMSNELVNEKIIILKN